jgi:transcriptional regulator with XRE-family HTH domain
MPEAHFPRISLPGSSVNRGNGAAHIPLSTRRLGFRACAASLLRVYCEYVMRTLANLKALREARGFSQRDLAHMSGVAQPTVGQLERGERKARPSTLRKLANALELEPSALLSTEQPTTAAEPAKDEMSGRPKEYRRWSYTQPTSLTEVGIRFYSEEADDYSPVFSSMVEGYAAGYALEDDVIPYYNVASIDRSEALKEPQAKLNSEEAAEAADLALFIAGNIAESLEAQTGAESLLTDVDRLPDHYYSNPDSARRLARLGLSLAAWQRDYSQEAARTIRELILLYELAMEKCLRDMRVLSDEELRSLRDEVEESEESKPNYWRGFEGLLQRWRGGEEHGTW